MTLIPELQRDLVDAAGRLGRPRLRAPVALRVVAAAAAFVVAAVVLLADDGEPGSSPSDSVLPVSPPTNPPTDSPPTDPPPTDPPITAPPRPRIQPVAESESPPLGFEFHGVRYSAVGLRSKGSVICIVVERAARGREVVPNSGSCLRDRLLSDALEERRVHMFAGGGGWPAHAAGFARTDVTELSLVGPDAADGKVVLSEPWSPEPWEGDPIRFVYVLTDGPADRRPSLTYHRFRAELTNGEVVPAP
jgi:hypothetical protein